MKRFAWVLIAATVASVFLSFNWKGVWFAVGYMLAMLGIFFSGAAMGAHGERLEQEAAEAENPDSETVRIVRALEEGDRGA